MNSSSALLPVIGKNKQASKETQQVRWKSPLIPYRAKTKPKQAKKELSKVLGMRTHMLLWCWVHWFETTDFLGRFQPLKLRCRNRCCTTEQRGFSQAAYITNNLWRFRQRQVHPDISMLRFRHTAVMYRLMTHPVGAFLCKKAQLDLELPGKPCYHFRKYKSRAKLCAVLKNMAWLTSHTNIIKSSAYLLRMNNIQK